MLAVLFIVGALCPLRYAAIDIGLMNPQSDGVLTAIFPNAFLLRYPNCSVYGTKNIEVLYQELSGKTNETQSFLAPLCNETRLSQGYLLTKLKNGTTYSMWYKAGGDISSILTNATTNVNDFHQIDDGLPARSGAMVVITVILVLAMVALLCGIIFLMFFSN